MGNVVKFEAHGKKYDLSIIDQDGQKWITAQQLGEALGLKQYRRLIHGLKKAGELKEGKHCRPVTERRPDGKLTQYLALSYRGVVRVAMRAQSSRARLFRDWMEDVLIEVMVTGTYQTPEVKEDIERRFALAQRDALMRGIALSDVLRDYDREMVVRSVHFRRMGLSQPETAGALGISIDRIQRLEKSLKAVGVSFQPVNINHRDKVLKDRLVDNLIQFPEQPSTSLELIQ